MTPDAVLKAAYSINAVDEIGTWSPERGPVYLTLSMTDPYGPAKDMGRLFLRLNREEVNVVVTALLTHHENLLAGLGVAPENPE